MGEYEDGAAILAVIGQLPIRPPPDQREHLSAKLGQLGVGQPHPGVEDERPGRPACLLVSAALQPLPDQPGLVVQVERLGRPGDRVGGLVGSEVGR